MVQIFLIISLSLATFYFTHFTVVGASKFLFSVNGQNFHLQSLKIMLFRMHPSLDLIG